MSPDRSWRSALFNSTALFGLSALAGTLLLADFATPARAQNWTGTVSDDWFDGDNWDNGQPPPSALDGVLNTVTPNPTVIDGGAASVRNLTLGGGLDFTGDLSIINGGTLTAGVISAAGAVGSAGSVTVSGPGSRLTTSGSVAFGDRGTGTLSVLDGGAVVVDIGTNDAVRIGYDVGGIGNASVSGIGSSLTTPGGLLIGRLPDSTGTLMIADGGAVSAVTAMLGEFAGALGEATVDGGGSTLSSANTLTVGGAGNANLEITGGGAATAGAVTLGEEASAQGTLEVSGVGSTLTHTGTFGEFVVGFSGGNGTLTVGAGAVATSGNNVYLGLQSGGQGSATVTGAGSQLLVDEGLFVGRTGTGMLSVGDGGRVEAGGIVIGAIAGTGAVTVAGAGSVLDVDGLIVAEEGGDGSLLVEDGGLVDSANSSAIGIGGTGAVTVTGAGSVWNAADLSFVGFISSGSLNVLEGGVVNGVDMSVGHTQDAQGAVMVSGDGSRLQNSGLLTIGNNATGTLTVANSATAASSTIDVGAAGTGTLLIESGGSLTSSGGPQSRIGYNAGGIGTATVTGAGSSWTLNQALIVGREDDSDGTLTVADGGLVQSALGVVGDLAGAQGTASVTGPGSAWNNGGVLFVGNFGQGALTIADGGSVTSTAGGLGGGGEAVATVMVTGSDSIWTIGNALNVGNNGAATVEIDDGGAVVANVATLGLSATGSGEVAVSGAGSLQVAGDLDVGAAGTGTLTLTNGGLVSVGDTVVLAEQSDSIGTLNFGAVAGDPAAAAGTLNAATVSFGAGTGTINFNHTGTGYEFAPAVSGDGSVNVLAGTTIFTADNTYIGATTIDAGATLRIGNGGATGSITSDVVDNGALIFDRSGTLAYGGDISGSGTLTKTGAGTTILSGASNYTGATSVNAGELRVEGSLGDTATTVASGARLRGSGSIAGDVTIEDGGTIAPGSSAGTLTVGSLALTGGSVLDYELGQAGVIGGGVNDLIEVTGNLVLDGTLNITDIGGFGPGVYRLMNYGGTLTDNVLELGGLPAGAGASDLFVQTRIAGEVNLISSVGAVLNFWDGGDAALHDDDAIAGGNGVWDAANRNWTQADGAINGQWNQDFAVFGGAAGTVTVDNSAGDVLFTGMQFMTDGYVVAGEALTTNTAETIIRTDPGVGATIAASINGSGGLVKQDTGTLVLSGANSYAGGTSILNGTLRVSADANLGAASGNLTFDGGTLQNTAAFATARDITLGAAGGTFQTDADLTVSGVISGAGALTKVGGGILTLTGANTYAGGTAIQGGGVIATVTGALGTGPVTIDAASGTSGVLEFTGSAQAGTLGIELTNPRSFLSFRQNASAGNAVIDNGGRINFYDASSAASATITNHGGGLSFNGNSTAGNATIDINRTALDFYGSSSAGQASIHNTFGAVRFAGSNTADGATIINSGRVDISNLETDGIGIGSLSGAGAVYLGSKILTLGRLGENATIGGVIADGGIAGGAGGTLVKIGAGTLALTGANAYTGGTTVNAGRLDIGGGGATGSIAGDVEVAAGGTLAFNRSNDFAFDGLIGGDGTIEKLAGGTLTLTGDSDGFTGTTTVNAGTLAVNGTLGGALDVLSGGRLEGTGTVGTTTVASGGTIAPGNSIDTLSVAGDITFAAGSTYEVEISPDLEGDLIDASGAADIDGGTVHVLKAAGTYTPGSRWTIVSADGGVAGEFGDLTQNMPFVDLALAYDPSNVYLDVTRNDVSFCDVALTSNQCSTGTGVESTGPGNPIYDAVAAIPDEESARQALDALSGEIHASLRGAFLEDSRFVREAMLDRTRSSLGGIAAPALPVMGYGSESLTPEQQEALVKEGKSARAFAPAAADTDRFAVWARGFGSWGNWDSDGNAADFERSIGGIFVGADAAVAETWRVGLVTGYSRSSFHADDRASSGDSDNYHLGLFGGTSFGNLGLSFAAAHTWHDIETGRGIAFPGFADSAEASYDARTAQMFGELGYRIDGGSFAFEPFANLAYVNVHTDGFAEDGGAAALTSASGTTDATFTTIGLRASTDFRLGEMKATARGMLGWRHAFGDVTPLADFAFAGGDAFAIAGTPIAEDALVLEAGFDVGLSEKTSLGVSYSGQIASEANDHGFRADLTVKF